jgi:hypothetical protein
MVASDMNLFANLIFANNSVLMEAGATVWRRDIESAANDTHSRHCPKCLGLIYSLSRLIRPHALAVTRTTMKAKDDDLLAGRFCCWGHMAAALICQRVIACVSGV